MWILAEIILWLIIQSRKLRDPSGGRFDVPLKWLYAVMYEYKICIDVNLEARSGDSLSLRKLINLGYASTRAEYGRAHRLGRASCWAGLY